MHNQRAMRAVFATLAFVAGCSTITLRPVQRDHAIRKAEVSSKLGVDEPTLNATLAADQAECDALDASVTKWTVLSLVAGGLAGGSGLTTIITDNQITRYVIGGVGIGVAVLTPVFAFMSASYSQKYARRCAINTGGK
jgi:hypothetical protein